MRQVERGKLHETLRFFGMVLGGTLGSAEGNTFSGSFPFYHPQKNCLKHFVFATLSWFELVLKPGRMYVYCCFLGVFSLPWDKTFVFISACVRATLWFIAQNHSLP